MMDMLAFNSRALNLSSRFKKKFFLRDKPTSLEPLEAKDINTLALPRHHSPNPGAEKKSIMGITLIC